jgi:hypothetical protein
MNAQEESAFVEAMRAVFGEPSEQFGEPLVEMLREFWLIARPKRCRFFFVPGVLVSPDRRPLVREQCTFPNGHEGPHSFEALLGINEDHEHDA